MPLYEYLCNSCGHRFERIQKFADAPIAECPSCGAGGVEKLLSSPAIQFKGSGFYITDYAKPGSRTDAAKGGDGKGTGDKATGDKATGDKPAAASPGSGGGTSKDSGTSAPAPASAKPAT